MWTLLLFPRSVCSRQIGSTSVQRCRLAVQRLHNTPRPTIAAVAMASNLLKHLVKLDTRVSVSHNINCEYNIWWKTNTKEIVFVKYTFFLIISNLTFQCRSDACQRRRPVWKTRPARTLCLSMECVLRSYYQARTMPLWCLINWLKKLLCKLFSTVYAPPSLILVKTIFLCVFLYDKWWFPVKI